MCCPTCISAPDNAYGQAVTAKFLTLEVILNLLVVEPDDIQAEIYQLSLAEAFFVDVADSFENARIMMRDKYYQLVVCEWEIEREKASCLTHASYKPDYAASPVIVVVSHHAEEETMVEAYNGGISYYFTKPYTIVPFYETLLAIQDQIEALQQLEHDKKQSVIASEQAVNRAAIYRLGLETLGKLNDAKSVADIAHITLTALKEQGIHAALEFRHNNRPLYFDGKSDSCDETTVKVFTTLRKQGEYFSFGQRLMLNAEHVSMLLKQTGNLTIPLQSVLTDLGTKFMPLLNMRYVALLQEQALFDAGNDVNKLVNKLHDVLIDRRDQKHKLSSRVRNVVVEDKSTGSLKDTDKEALVRLLQQATDSTLNDEELINADALLAGIAARMHSRLVDLSVREISGEDDDLDDELRGLEYF